MLSRFRRPEADLQIRIDRTVVHADDELEARVTLVPKGDFHVRHGKVELVCTESYVQRVSTQYGTSYHRRTETLSRAGETFIDDRTVRHRVPYSTDVRLVVPPDALPTIIGTKVSSVQPGIAWAVTASLDVAKARDIRQSQEVTVVKPPVLDDARPRPVRGRGRGFPPARERPRGGAASYFHGNWPCWLRPTPPKMKMVAAFGGSEDAGGDTRAPSLGPRSPIGVGDRLRGDDG